MKEPRRLGGDVGIVVGWTDDTPFGGPLGSRFEDHLREVFAPVRDAIEGGADPVGPEVLDALASAVRGPSFADLATVEDDRDFDPTASGVRGWVLHDAVLHPAPELTAPSTATFLADGGARLEVRLTPRHWPLLHDAVARLSGPGLIGSPADPDIAQLVASLDAHGFLDAAESPRAGVREGSSGEPGVTLVGHATVLVRSERAAILIDPFLPPRSARYPATCQPLQVDELGPIDAVLVTHAHPDHFDPATLLRLPTDVPIIVPDTDRESLLGPVLALRMRQLGFTDVRALSWGSHDVFGDLALRVLPFLGEQPSTGPTLHSDVVMPGNTYVVTAPWGRVATIADGGDDRRGTIVDAARRERDEHGPVDVVCAGFRGWHTSPAELLGSSVGRYALFVPPERWGAREDLMNDPAGAVATAEAFGARTLVPYADGGAPWFWEIGLGPRLDTDDGERAGFDLAPERVAEAAAAAGSDIDVAILRPGESLDPAGTVLAAPDRAWPWATLPSAVGK